MTHDDFLQEILADPDDDVPRLIYADWLEEHGDPLRAEFIRAQCELARLASEDAPLQEAWKHELAASVKYGARWQTTLPIWTAHLRLRPRRGFAAVFYTSIPS